MANHFRLSPNLTMGVDVFSSRLRRLTSNHSRRVKSWIDRKQAKQEDQAAIKKLLNCTNRELLDIGITRSAVLWASSLPEDCLGTAELQKIARHKKAAKSVTKGAK